MEHRAFLFDYERFQQELAPVLERALSAAQTTDLARFVDDNLDRLTDPYEGEPLAADWRDQLENADVHEIGDYALTAYYDPADDRGLGPDWTDVNAWLSGLLDEGQADAVTLGDTFGPPSDPFDPGRMGSYFRSPQATRQHRALVTDLLARTGPDDAVAGADDFATLLGHAEHAGTGLYVTF